MNGSFKVPTVGYYKVDFEINIAHSTGKFENVPDENKKWWQFWKPDLVSKEILEWETIKPESKMVKASAGERLYFGTTNEIVLSKL